MRHLTSALKWCLKARPRKLTDITNTPIWAQQPAESKPGADLDTTVNLEGCFLGRKIRWGGPMLPQQQNNSSKEPGKTVSETPSRIRHWSCRLQATLCQLNHSGNCKWATVSTFTYSQGHRIKKKKKVQQCLLGNTPCQDHASAPKGKCLAKLFYISAFSNDLFCSLNNSSCYCNIHTWDVILLKVPSNFTDLR